MKTGSDDFRTVENGTRALNTAENESGSENHENGSRRSRYREKRLRELKTSNQELTPSLPPKMSPEAQNIKTGPDALDIAENEAGRVI
jgi:hypothetical protein